MLRLLLTRSRFYSTPSQSNTSLIKSTGQTVLPSIVEPLTNQFRVENLSPLPRIKKKRIGRGGKSGGSSGRGNGGQKHHNKTPGPWFTGLASNSIYEQLPKWTWTPREFKPHWATVNLDRIQFYLQKGLLKGERDQEGRIKVGLFDLVISGCIKGRVQDGIKLLANGSEYFTEKIDIEVTRASKTAIEAIEKCGGRVTTFYHTKTSLEQILNPEKAPLRFFHAAPLLESDLLYYSSPENRGYLCDKDRFINELRPRGYLWPNEPIPQQDGIFDYQALYTVSQMDKLLKELEEKRHLRQKWKEEEEERKLLEKEQKSKAWENQQWFKGQPATPWVEISKDGEVKNHFRE